MQKRLLMYMLVVGSLWRAAAAQEASTPRDSLRSYDLAEIVVSTANASEPEPPTTVQKISLAGINREDAVGVSDVLRLLPATHVQTNSRGETLLYIRNAGERQVALFFDGALLNVPWDNRVDLALIPASVVGSITVAKGIPSVLYGTNVLGGAVSMTSRTSGDPGALTEIGLRGGLPRAGQTVVTRIHRSERWRYAGSFGYASSTGMALPGAAEVPFSQHDDDLRTNTDLRSLNVFGSADYRFGRTARLGVSLLHVDGEKGVAPESHLDPATSRVRYWRYPLWHTTMLILNGSATPAPGTVVRGAAWATRFEQHIDQYASSAFDVLNAREEGRDGVLGMRLTLGRATGPGELRLALNALTARHEAREHSFDADSATAPMTFQQHTLSTGAEYGGSPRPGVQLMAGASLDAMLMPRTGDKPTRDPFYDYSLSTGVRVALGPNASVRATAGRKVRFPTMRELFGEALRRFKVNPDLQPETSFLGEVALEAATAPFAGEVIVFLNRTYDTIDQRTLPDGRRERINLEGSRVYGVEAGGTFQPVPRLSFDGHVTWMHPRAFTAAGTRPLAEKPEWLGTLTATYATRGGLSLLVQPVYTGTAFSMAEDGSFRRLPAALVLNLRLAYRLFRAEPPSFFSELFVRVDNVTDAVVLPQLGLPGAGRSFALGLNVTL